ncbi:LmbE family protein [Candidatus Aerophobetes bacterium Ae_b3b]|nr:MAG: LmbE family protein [Candidatus Aerophobetes bacterium Ae_b3b]
MRVLAVGAHPDDLEFLCVGTLAKFKEKKVEIFMFYLCNGNKGHFEIPSPELAKIRKKEAEESAKILGAEIQGGIFPDLDIYPDKESRKKVVDLVRVARPDLVITHSPKDYMCDHTTTSKLLVDASFIATLPNYKTEHKPHALIPPIFFMDTLAGVNFLPTEYVDITDFIDIKEKMLLCHQSQYKWLKEHDGIDYVDFMRKVASFRGLQCGVPFAEGFRAYSVWGRIKPKRLLP